FTTIANAGYQFMLSASVTLSPDADFSFTGFRLTMEIEEGEHYLEFNSLISSSLAFMGQTMSPTDPGGGMSYQAVPEPSSLVLLVAAGAAGLAWRGRSRRRSGAL